MALVAFAAAPSQLSMAPSNCSLTFCCRRTKLKPPGALKPPRKAGAPARKRNADEKAAERQLQAAALAALDAPTLRQSTRQRTEDAERERMEQVGLDAALLSRRLRTQYRAIAGWAHGVVDEGAVGQVVLTPVVCSLLLIVRCMCQGSAGAWS